MTMVIDAGHGGMDGGAAGADGTTEQKINLDIAKALQAEAKKYGISAVLTRESEDGLYEEENGGKWSKVGDMRQRKRIIEEEDPDLVVSIHLNSFISDTSVHGAQVFYPKEGESSLVDENKALAEKVQAALKEELGEEPTASYYPKAACICLRTQKEICFWPNADFCRILTIWQT